MSIWAAIETLNEPEGPIGLSVGSFQSARGKVVIMNETDSSDPRGSFARNLKRYSIPVEEANIFSKKKIETLIELKDRMKLLKGSIGIMERIKEISNKWEKIIVYGDYDADGIGSAVLFADFLDFLQIEHKVFLPERESDGYGLREDNIQKLIELGLWENGYKHVFCLDNGVNQVGVFERLNEAGFTFSVIDHHTEDEELAKKWYDQSVFQVNPHLKENAGVFAREWNVCTGFLVYAFAISYFLKYWMQEEFKMFSECERDVLLITTIGDVMPMRWLNREIVRHFRSDFLFDRSKMRKTLAQLVDLELNEDISPVQVDSSDRDSNDVEKFIAFNIVPKLNALWRIDSALRAFWFLRWESDNNGNFVTAEDIRSINKERKDMTDVLKKKIAELYMTDLKSDEKFFLYTGDASLFNKEWLKSIFSWWLASEFWKVVWIGLPKDWEVKFSFRSAMGVNLKEVIGKKYPFKWHKEAWVVSIPVYEIENFRTHLREELANMSESGKETTVIGELPWSMFNCTTVDMVNSLGPYGNGLPYPLFSITGEMLKWKSNGSYCESTKTGKQKIRIKSEFDEREITAYNFSAPFQESQLRKAKSFVGYLRYPFGNFSKEPVFVLEDVVF